MKKQVNKMAIWLNGKLMNGQGGEMTIWWNGKITSW
jgi:hypothetical protein